MRASVEGAGVFNMMQANLIPIPRRMARQRHHRIRRWVSICSVYCALLVAAYGTLQAMWGRGDQIIEHDVSRLMQEIAQTDQEMKTVAPKLQEARLTLAASMAVGSQPNWSILLALLAREMKEDDHAASSLHRALLDTDRLGLTTAISTREKPDPASIDSRRIVLSQCELAPVSEAATSLPGVAASDGSTVSPAATAVAQQRYTLTLAGMGRSQAAISQYVLRLENTGLFDRVTLIESKLAPFGGGEAVSFRIGCTLGETGK